ncbi:hypothetical protein FRC19_008735 [Serendipita sp. 401]|nr:hypothetical protein FRC19_008735 [Serendipita sp. 401]
MASQLILAAPRPIKAVHLPFFLRNALSPCSPVSPSAALVVGGQNVRRPNSSHGASHLFESKQPPPMVADHPETAIGYTNNILINSVETEPSIEQLTARIRLTDDHDSLEDSFLFGTRSSSVSRQRMSPFAYEKFTQSPSLPPRSPEGAVLEEFLSILRPVIRAPSSPIARSTRLVPRSRRSHQTLGLGPSSDRHHPYARSAKSTSPLETSESHTEIIGKSTAFASGSKRSSGRSSASYSARRRNSNANDSSSHSGHSAGSSRSRSVSRRGSDGSLNYYRANNRRAVCE